MRLRRFVQVAGGSAVGLIVAAGITYLMEGAPPGWGGQASDDSGQDKQSPVMDVADSAIGGQFQLLNHKGQKVTQQALKGEYDLLYFGFTNCPDVCPTNLGIMADVLDKAAQRPFKVNGYFVSIDPDRDSVQRVRKYVKGFHPDMRGLTGSRKQVLSIAKPYKVGFNKVDSEGNKAPQANKNYLLDHTSYTYLVEPDGKVSRLFRHATAPQTILDTIARRYAANQSG